MHLLQLKIPMNTSWTVMKNLISAAPKRPDLYLSIIDEEGTITSANMNMQKGLKFKDPRIIKTNFFDLFHPVHINHFKKIIQDAAERKEQITAELFVKNRFYQPVKWQVNHLQMAHGNKKVYFCIGYCVIDTDRLKKFNKLLEKHHQLIMEGLTGIIFHDKEGELIAANQQTTGLLNTTFEKLYRAKSIRDLWTLKWKVADENGKPVAFEDAPFVKAIKYGRPQKQTLQVSLENGEYRWILFHSQLLPAKDHEEETSCVVSNIIDVTTEKILAIKLQEKEAIFNAFVSKTPNLSWIVDEDTRLIFASNAFYDQFGLNETDCLNRKMEELIPSPVFKTLYKKHTDVLKTSQPVKATEKVRLADGTNYISHINIFLLESRGGKKLIGGYAINLPDTTRLETDLREANERLLTLTHLASDAIWEWDMQTGKIFRNDILMQMIGYHRDDAKGLSWWLRRIHPEDRNRVSDKVKEVTETNQHSWQDEYRLKCADGQYKHIRDKGFVIYENGLPVKMVGSLHDITTLKELEDKLASEKLQRQKEISETIIQVQEKERTRIGHELHDNVNQVLSAAMLFTNMLNPSEAEQKQAKEKSIEYLLVAIEEIRKLSKELVVPQLKEQGLANGIQSLINDVHFTDKIRIEFIHEIDAALISSGKKITLFRIIQEQVKNILNHSKAGNAVITLQMKEDNIQLIIKDDGVGFDSRQTHRGIGLSNIYERVNFYSGTVDIQTAPGKGCTVMVTLPVL